MLLEVLSTSEKDEEEIIWNESSDINKGLFNKFKIFVLNKESGNRSLSLNSDFKL